VGVNGVGFPVDFVLVGGHWGKQNTGFVDGGGGGDILL